MKAIVQDTYGSADVLELRDIDRPALGDGAVLVRIRAPPANPLDWHFMRGTPYIACVIAGLGLRKSRISDLGADIAGEVEAVGNKVTRFRRGDEVFGFVSGGGFAEYVSKPEELLARNPAKLSFQQAATVPLAALNAHQQHLVIEGDNR